MIPGKTNSYNNLTGIVKLLLILVLVLSGSLSYASGAFDLLRIDQSPAGAALGGFAISHARGNIGSLHSNPAGMAGLETRNAAISYSDHPLDLSAGLLTYGQPVFNGYGAVAVNYFNYGEFERYESLESPQDGTFTPTDLMLVAGYSRSLPRGISLGVSGKYINSKIDDSYSSNAIALDTGVSWDTGWNYVHVAAVISNIGFQLSDYAGVSEDLPTTARVGASKKLEHLPLRLGANVHFERDEDIFITGCGEFQVSDQLKLRAGYTTLATDYKVGGQKDGIAGISGGAGITIKNMIFNYAFQSFGAIGNVHRLGINVNI